MILTADVGGTKTALAIFEVIQSKFVLKVKKQYLNKSYESFEEILKSFLKESSFKVKAFSLGIAGPVHNESVKLTNIKWEIKKSTLAHLVPDADIYLLNDLQALAYSLNILEEGDLLSLQKPIESTPGNQTLLSIGTGLGISHLAFNAKHYQPFASEGGHTDFAPRNPKEIALLNYLSKPFGHVSYERVLSGAGLYNIYQFLNDYHSHSSSKEFALEIKEKDPASVIIHHALNHSDPICTESLDLLISIYGAKAGNSALSMLAYGGVFLSGGLTTKIIDQLKGPRFLESFTNKGRFQTLMYSFPISVILNQNATLLGAAHYALIQQ